MKLNQTQKYIPDCWQYLRLEELAQTSSGGTPKSDNLLYYIDGKIPWLTSGEIRKGKINSFENFITEAGLKSSSAKVFPKDTVLIAMYGATAGQVGILEKESTTNQAICGILPNEKYSPLFLYYFFKMRTKILLNMGTGAAQPNISQDVLRNFDILLPPLPEQKRIVAVLETWDEVIEKLAWKIEVKKNVKKGLMQKLLTGKVRLPGFGEKWETVKLGDVCDIITGKKDVNQGNPNGKYPFFTCAKTPTASNDYSFDTEAILIAGNGEVGNCLYYKGKFEAYQRTYVLAKFNDVNIFYLYAYLKYFFQSFIMSQTQMGAMPYIKLGMLIDFKINIPKSKEEQDAIAEVLTKSDKEIELLQEKLNKLKDQKKYLLNNLITGRIRTPEVV